ncbi:DNA glycosylase/AP lyase [Mucor mucedo]|uniref:DNA glycosylase/AP lyase n=1 Tax=Mucor mucedo TaxID=29922 RepID=UPI00221F72E8|nr:DNA glycosylase/AP lyase [Mucor mucedo]KAI7890599.1 DNA glycosylase/AP lyase [Mucor mucedo]
MPEIAEVERARLRIHRQLLNHKIVHVETQPDALVFKDITPTIFSEKILDRTLVDTKRWGKYFILLFDKGPSMVAHFGMTGGIRFQHEEKPENWPPKFWKLLITFQDPYDKEKTIQFAFKDPRRLARLRLVEGKDPLLEDPIKKLGFDPVLSLPPPDIFNRLVLRRAVPVKALLLDQSFSAGVGNWVADEVLYQAKIHPAQYTNTLTMDELTALYEKLKFVCETAVKKEADESKFPEDWLMKYRWNKGKKTGQKLPNGVSLKFETVAGRTSAFAPSRQILRKSVLKKTIVKKSATQDISTEKIPTTKQDNRLKQKDEIPGLRRSSRSLSKKQ